MTRIYLCRIGMPGTYALESGWTPSASDWAAYATAGLVQARLGRRYEAHYSCPVNGDGYSYWCVELVDPFGEVVGHATTEDAGLTGA
jgi:hypothetical protein